MEKKSRKKKTREMEVWKELDLVSLAVKMEGRENELRKVRDL